jgi:predicted phosphate transport protein (TIGR00153 family)
MRTIAKVFGRSPFVPLQMHMEKVAECVDGIPEILDAYKRKDSKTVESLSKKISQLEHDADVIKHDIRNSLPRGMFMPVDRANLLRILNTQDGIANRAENIAVLLTFKQAGTFKGFEDTFDAFVTQCLDAFTLARKILDQLDELLETGFGGIEAQTAMELVDMVAQKEYETDVGQRELVRELLAHEDDISYGDFFLWTRIIRQVASVADQSEKLATAIRMTLESK